jgi:hypothetical protein
MLKLENAQEMLGKMANAFEFKSSMSAHKEQSRRAILDAQSQLKRIDLLMDVLDWSVDMFWDELFAIYDLLVDKEMATDTPGCPCDSKADQSPQASADNTLSETEYKQLFETTLIDRYVDMVIHEGRPVHLMRTWCDLRQSKQLSMASKALEIVFDKLSLRSAAQQRSDDDAGLFVITVIGEQVDLLRLCFLVGNQSFIHTREHRLTINRSSDGVERDRNVKNSAQFCVV